MSLYGEMTMDDQIQKEIQDHPNWCSPRCQTFLPDAYREKRQRYSAETVQRDYDLCHIWR